ncbi:MAG TPA: epoxyqueuosine reductase QueH [Candidatus Mailhella merdavium]|nr:epoxyqueuosine reductase QueH [Candidatus Mailhella merdavium]
MPDEKMDMLPKGASVLLHSCCGPCSIMPVRRLRDEGLDVTAFFFNPNIHPADEYKKRRTAMRELGEKLDLPVLFRPELSLPGDAAVSPALWTGSLETEVPRCLADYEGCTKEEYGRLFTSQPGDSGEGTSPEYLREGVRCVWCYRVRMEASAALARERDCAAFTSSLLYSRYQHHELIVAEAERASRLFGVPFLYRDFRSDWQEGIDASKELGLYRQKWCGCALSRNEAEAWKRRREERRAALRAARRAEHEANAARKRGKRDGCAL